MGGRVYRAAVVTPPENPKGRVYRAAVAGTSSAAAPRGRVYRAGMAGTGLTAGKARVYRAAVAGTAAVNLAPIPSRIVEPATLVEITALLTGGTPGETYIWRQVSGPTVSFIGSGPTRSFVAPSDVNGTTVVVGVRCMVGSTSSSEVLATVNVLPQIVWTRTNADPAWRGCRLDF